MVDKSYYISMYICLHACVFDIKSVFSSWMIYMMSFMMTMKCRIQTKYQQSMLLIESCILYNSNNNNIHPSIGLGSTLIQY